MADPITPGTWSVSPSGAYTATAGETILEDNNGNQIKCPTATAAGSLNSGATGSPAVLGSITSATFGSGANCTGPLSSTWSVTATMPWSLNGVTYDSATGVTVGTVTGVRATLTGTTILGTCTIQVTLPTGGAVDGTYTNGTGVLAVAATAAKPFPLSLAPTGAGCATIGTTAKFTANYSVKNTGTNTAPQITAVP